MRFRYSFNFYLYNYLDVYNIITTYYIGVQNYLISKTTE